MAKQSTSAPNDANATSQTISFIENLKTELLSQNEQLDITISSVDMGDAESIRTFVQMIQSKWKKIDVLVNNAGLFIMGGLADIICNMFNDHRVWLCNGQASSVF